MKLPSSELMFECDFEKYMIVFTEFTGRLNYLEFKVEMLFLIRPDLIRKLAELAKNYVRVRSKNANAQICNNLCEHCIVPAWSQDEQRGCDCSHRQRSGLADNPVSIGCV